MNLTEMPQAAQLLRARGAASQGACVQSALRRAAALGHCSPAGLGTTAGLDREETTAHLGRASQHWGGGEERSALGAFVQNLKAGDQTSCTHLEGAVPLLGCDQRLLPRPSAVGNSSFRGTAFPASIQLVNLSGLTLILNRLSSEWKGLKFS